MLNGLTSLAATWGEFYGDHTVLQTGITFAHVGGLLMSGGLALASDRVVLRARQATPAERRMRLADLGSLHRTVLSGLAIVALSGLALFFADLETFLTSWVFWLKMGLVAALLVNGGLLVQAERALAQDPESEPGWRSLGRGAAVSASLWLLIALLGTALVNVA